jgi:two-component system sensor histidine kinase/response regulator
MKNPAVKLPLVDDNSDNLFLLETLLKSDDVEVVLARSGVEALDQLKVH